MARPYGRMARGFLFTRVGCKPMDTLLKVALHVSFPRRRESIVDQLWVPAFAGTAALILILSGGPKAHANSSLSRLQNRENKARMSMKTNDEDRKSESCRVPDRTPTISSRGRKAADKCCGNRVDFLRDFFPDAVWRETTVEAGGAGRLQRHRLGLRHCGDGMAGAEAAGSGAAAGGDVLPPAPPG